MKTHLTPKKLTCLLYRCLAPALLLAALGLPARAGVALKLEYDGIPGTAVVNLTTNSSFPSSPTFYSVLATGLEEPVNFADNFGAWTRGFIEAPQSGAYTFWIASDDDGEFWLSSDETPAHLVKIAENIGAVAQYAYLNKPAQQSAPVTLVAGQKYYFEMLHKEGGGNDHCSIGWQLPDGTFQNVVPSGRIWPFPVNLSDPSYPPITEAPSILTAYQGVPVDQLDPSGSTSVEDGRPLDLTVTIEATQPAYVQWYSNSVAIPGANLSTCHIPRVTMAMNGAVYSVTVTNSIAPAASASTTLSVMADTTPPSLIDALNTGNPAGDVAVVFSEGVDPVSGTTVGNYSLNNGASVVSAVMSTNPAVVLLRTTGMVPGTTYTLTVQNVNDLASTPNTLSPNPSTVVLEQDLHTWMRMDEATGVTATDSSGNGRNGTLTNGVAPGYTGKVQAAMKFDGVTGYIEAQRSADDFSTNGLTVAVWAYPLDNLENWARFIDYAVGPFSDNILFARNGTSSDLTFEVYNGTTSGGKVTASGAIALRQWQHFAVTMDVGGNVTIYKNGVAVATGVTAVPNPVVRTNNFVGHSNMPQDGYYFGKMDDLRVYTRVLDPAAIAALAAGGGADDSSLPAVSVAATVPTTALKNAPPGVFTLTRTGSTAAPLTVFYMMGGTATNGVAYTNLSGSVTIPAGTNAAQVYLTPKDFSFSQVQETAILMLAGNSSYTIGDADSGTVTIQNNDVAPAARLATAENGFGANTNRIDVWFGAAITQPSATTLSNYRLINAGGATITSATLSSNRNLRVVLTLSAPVPTNALLVVTNVLDQGGNTGSNQVPILCRVESINVVANVYHGAATTRPAAFGYVSDGVVNNTANAGTGFDTFSGAANNQTHFGGMTYPHDEDFEVIKVDLGQQFADGGDWQAQPFVYILKNPVDTGSTRPETDTNNWEKVPAVLISGSQFQTAVDPNPSPNTPIVFDLTSLPASQRHGYGWAVGGVLGNGTTRFLSFSELRAYGYTGPANTVGYQTQPQNLTVTQGQRGTFVQSLTNSMGAVFSYQWQKNGVNIAGATDVNYSFPPAATTDNGATFDVVGSPSAGAAYGLASGTASLTVLARTAAPSLVAANLDPVNFLIDVWFDEAVDGNTAQNPSNYSLNDPALSVTAASTNANGYCVTLSYSGTPSVPNLTVAASGVLDFFGHTMGTQSTAVLPLCGPVVNVVANQYQQGRATAGADSTNGVVIHATGDANVWQTFDGSKSATTTDFVGLLYTQPQVFGVIKVDLGWQFSDGGDWELQPQVYVLKNPADTNQRYPETDPLNWVAVPAPLISGNVFDYAVDGPVGTPVNTPIAFDLSHLPLSQRTGYGWAVGGAPANQAAHFLSITELRAFGVDAGSFTNVSGPPQVLLDLPASLSQPAGLPLTLTVYATGTQPITYQWKRNGVDLVDGGLVSGAHTSVLTLAEAFASDAGTYQLAMTNSAGVGFSTACVVSLTRNQPNAGFNWSINGVNGSSTWVPVVNANTVTLTDGLGNERSSVFLNYPQYVGAFAASFTYQDVGGGGADGIAFVLHDDPRGAQAVGGGGGQLGYGGITPSLAMEFNLYGPNSPSGTSSGFAFRSNGATGTPYADCTPVSPASGNTIAVSLRYDGTTAWLVLSNTTRGGVFTTNYLVDVPTLLGTNTAYVGFTGGSGGVGSTQQVSNFYFASIPVLAAAPVSPGVLQLSWPATADGLVLQKTTSLSTPTWTTVNAPVNLVNGQNQVQISTLTGNGFYALRLP